MELITILNPWHRFRGFVYQHAYFSADKKSIEVAVRPCKGSAAVCSRCDLPAPGHNQLAERRFEFIPLWRFLVFLSSAPLEERVHFPKHICQRLRQSNTRIGGVHAGHRAENTQVLRHN
jgi:hypothetical protein